jgi:hypothetical protein
MGPAMAITAAASRPTGRALSAAWFDWLFLATSAWLVGGGYLDSWAHGHLRTLDTFFTPWHAVLYSGFAACAAVLVVRWLRERSLPEGYGLSLAGCGLFALGGLADMVWHTFFGIERQLAAVLSPSHLWLIVSGGLIVTGAIRAARPTAAGLAPPVAVLGAAVAFCWLGLTTEFAQPYNQRMAAAISRGSVTYNQSIATAMFGVMLQSALLVGLILYLRQRFELPFGSLTVIIGLEAFVQGAANNLDFMVLVGVLGGLAGDLWMLLLRNRPAFLAFAVPASLYACYIISLAIAYGTWWEVHALTGIVGVAGVTGWLVSVAMRRPAATAT